MKAFVWELFVCIRCSCYSHHIKNNEDNEDKKKQNIILKALNSKLKIYDMNVLSKTVLLNAAMTNLHKLSRAQHFNSYIMKGSFLLRTLFLMSNNRRTWQELLDIKQAILKISNVDEAS